MLSHHGCYIQKRTEQPEESKQDSVIMKSHQSSLEINQFQATGDVQSPKHGML